jgi:ribonuclease D
MSQPIVRPELVTTRRALEEAAQSLREHKIIAVDTESNSLFAYREQVCLIQFSIPGHDYLIDPLALSDLSLLGPIFKDHTIEKIFHAAEYDLLTLQRDFGFQFRNIFDTMVAARILGRKRVGLGNLLEEEFGIHLEKKYQRADWGKRPLPRPMQEYACLDTHFLIRLRNLLGQELQQAGRWPIAREDFNRLTQVSGTPPEPNGVNVWRVNGVYDLKPPEVTILKELARYREEQAAAANRPVFKVIGDRTLIAIAAEQPNNLNALKEIPGMSPGQVHRHGRALLEAVRAGKQQPPTRRPRLPRKDDRVLILTDALKEWRKTTARKQDVESDIVLPRDTMEAIGEAMPSSRQALAEMMSDLPWRYQEYGEAIFRLVEKHSKNNQ